MARSTPTDRLERLIECATEVFIDRGYRRAQMSDVAAALRVAKGTLYLYVDSKEALFDLVVRYADDPQALPQPVKVPMPTPRPGATIRYVRERLSRNQVPQALLAALDARQVGDASTELGAIASELYDTLAANRRGIKLLDRSARDLPELAALWFEGARKGLIQALRRYLEDRALQGLLRAFPDTAAAARTVVETLVFWAVHRHWDTQPQVVEAAAARATAIQFVVNALVNR